MCVRLSISSKAITSRGCPGGRHRQAIDDGVGGQMDLFGLRGRQAANRGFRRTRRRTPARRSGGGRSRRDAAASRCLRTTPGSRPAAAAFRSARRSLAKRLGIVPECNPGRSSRGSVSPCDPTSTGSSVLRTVGREQPPVLFQFPDQVTEDARRQRHDRGKRRGCPCAAFCAGRGNLASPWSATRRA